MSAIGQGVTIICGNQLDGVAPPTDRDAMVPVNLGPFDQVTLSHYVGRKAWQIVISDENGNVMSSGDFPAFQLLNARPAPDIVTVSNQTGEPATVFISIRWQENSVEASLFPVGSLNEQQRDRTSTVGNAFVSISNMT